MGVVLVQSLTLCLVVWTVRSPDQRPLVIIYAKPVKAIDQKFNCPRDGAGCVGIFNSQDKRTPGMARIEPAKQGSAKATDMLEAGRAGGKAQARLFASRHRGLLFETIIGLGHRKMLLCNVL